MDQPRPRHASSRRIFMKHSVAAAAGLASLGGNTPLRASAPSKIWITDLKCAIMGGAPVVRITTNVGVDGYGQAETTKSYLKPFVLFYRDYLLGMDPTDVERALLKIRRLGSFKPWGAAVSAIEMALWDIAGKVAGVPVYKLMGGKIRDRVRVYNGGVRPRMTGQEPEDYAEAVAIMKEAEEGFTMVKMGVGFHSRMAYAVPDFFLGSPNLPGSGQSAARGAEQGERPQPKRAPHSNRGPLTEKGLKHIIACVEAMKNVLGDEIGLALDVGPRAYRGRFHPLGQGAGTSERNVARRSHHRRLHPIRHGGPLPRSYSEYHDPQSIPANRSTSASTSESCLSRRQCAWWVPTRPTSEGSPS